MVEEYVKDLYRIGLILLFTPFVSAILVGIALTILGQPVDFDKYNATLSTSALMLAGLFIMLYLSIKYYYKEGRYEKP